MFLPNWFYPVFFSPLLLRQEGIRNTLKTLGLFYSGLLLTHLAYVSLFFDWQHDLAAIWNYTRGILHNRHVFDIPSLYFFSAHVPLSQWVLHYWTAFTALVSADINSLSPDHFGTITILLIPALNLGFIVYCVFLALSQAQKKHSRLVPLLLIHVITNGLYPLIYESWYMERWDHTLPAFIPLLVLGLHAFFKQDQQRRSAMVIMLVFLGNLLILSSYNEYLRKQELTSHPQYASIQRLLAEQPVFDTPGTILLFSEDFYEHFTIMSYYTYREALTVWLTRQAIIKIPRNEDLFPDDLPKRKKIVLEFLKNSTRLIILKEEVPWFQQYYPEIFQYRLLIYSQNYRNRGSF